MSTGSTEQRSPGCDETCVYCNPIPDDPEPARGEAAAIDLDAIEAEARDHRRLTDVGRHVLPLITEVRRLRAAALFLEAGPLSDVPAIAPSCKTTHHACDCVIAEMERLRARVAELEAAPPYVPPLLRNAP